MNAWFRLYSEFATDPKVQSMSEVMQRRLVMLFCLRCGDVLVTLQERDVAFALRVTEQDLAETKSVFIERGFIDHDWKILNWSKRQFTSDSSTERTRAYRERLRTSQERNSDALDTDTDTDTEQKQRKTGKSPSPKNGSGTAHGTRLSISELPDEWKTFAMTDCGWDELRAAKTFEVFKDYWKSKAGQKARHADWFASWRNWCRREETPKNGSLPFPKKESFAERLKREDPDYA